MHFAAFLMAALLMIGGLARAEESADAPGIRSVIDSQIRAFQADDGATAYSFAAPQIRRMFPSADVFMAMVKNGYQPVYRPKSVAYGRLKEIPGGYAQEVFLVGPDGESYTALYRLERQPDGAWKISACQIVKAPAQSA
jgi:hypothetical protein